MQKHHVHFTKEKIKYYAYNLNVFWNFNQNVLYGHR